jgi:hypothetical protein
MQAAFETEKERDRKGGRPTHAGPSRLNPAAMHPIVSLQQQAGNLAVQQLLRSNGIQAKLAISQPADPEEHEADRVADRVMRAHAGAPIGSSCSCASGDDMCEQCRHQQSATVARKPAETAPPAMPHKSVEHVLRSAGEPLDQSARVFFEPRYNHDFSHVRVHAGREAGQSAEAIGARAYTSGHHIVFAPAEYRPSSSDGRRLIAHELAHVVQQFSQPTSPIIQRDLATPPPAPPAKLQPDLTPAQIAEAIAFNSARFDRPNTITIQKLLGGSGSNPDGVWTKENIEAIAATQEQYGLFKDGKVGNKTLRFLDREQSLEKMDTSTKNCLVSFVLIGPDRKHSGRNDATHCNFGSHVRIEAQFSPRCNCDQFQYRQFVGGHLRRTRAGVVTDLPVRVPGGVLHDAFTEDTDLSDPTAPNYGHRDQAVDPIVENHYVDPAGKDDQAHGCRYIGEDGPGTASLDDCLSGDRYDLVTNFQGEIQRNGSAIQKKIWTGFHLENWTP